jgi:hypothetical protein
MAVNVPGGRACLVCAGHERVRDKQRERETTRNNNGHKERVARSKVPDNGYPSELLQVNTHNVR